MEPADTNAAEPSRLELHAMAYRLNGLGIGRIGHDGATVAEPLWSLEQLTEAERAYLGAKLEQLLARYQGQALTREVRARLYGGILTAYGIACPHPAYWRRQHRPGAFECLSCDQLLIEKSA